MCTRIRLILCARLSVLELSSIAPMERYALRFLACRAVASLSGPTEWLTLKAAISMTTPLVMCACVFEPFPELSSIAPMERYELGFLACRAVASLSTCRAWLTLTAAISMTTPLHRPNGTRWNVTRSFFWLAGRGTLHLRHGDTDQHQRVLESGNWGALTFCPCLDISSIAPLEC